jgi:putative acetyltransferase
MEIRLESKKDLEAIRKINTRAFKQGGEARLVDLLRDSGDLSLSLVAEVDGELVGHLAFSPVAIDGEAAEAVIAGAGPLSVLPELQGKEIGSVLFVEGLKRIAAQGFNAVVLLGHAKYYPRFGFYPASQFMLRCEYDVPDEAFMAKELTPGALKGVHGVVHYHDAFEEVE